MYLAVDPSKVTVFVLILAYDLVDVDDLLNPAIWINASAAGAELNVTVIVFAVVVVVKAVVGTPSMVIYISDAVESKLFSPKMVNISNITQC